jgi:hypothetical protein
LAHRWLRASRNFLPVLVWTGCGSPPAANEKPAPLMARACSE